MSLIGSLEDLGLGDILQIIHLSQKSGVLSIHGDREEGRIVFQNGMVRLARVKGGPDDLRGLLVAGGFVSGPEFESATKSARESGAALSTVLANLDIVSLERIDSLRRECAEKAVGRMFSWSSGEFSFDVGAEDEFLSSEMALETGINTQYMAMESVRIWDESARGDARESDDSQASEAGEAAETELNLDLSAQEMFGVADAKDASESSDDVSAVPEVDGVMIEDEASESPVNTLASAVAERIAPGPEVAETPGDTVLPPVIVIDASLSVLEWVRTTLAKSCASVHVFQRSQEGLGRIRQYLARAQAPILLISPRIEGNPLSGIVDAADYVRRLRAQAPRMPIAWLVPSDDEALSASLPVALPTVLHPSGRALAASNSPEQPLALQLTLTLREELARLSAGRRPGGTSQAASVEVRSATAPTEDLGWLKAATQSLSDASNRGEILPMVIRFAAESFERVAMFMVRGEQILGMAQHGIDANGGPNDVEMRALRFERSDLSWFSEVIESGSPVRFGARNAGDRRLCELLGSVPERIAYIAPIVSAEQVVALLYADKGPGGQDPGDTSALEVVLHHAGLALDRAVLERALAEVEEER